MDALNSYDLTATNCCVCRRPLVDAKSVELGIGPICRQKHGFDVDIPEEARQEANKIVYAVACAQRITAAQRARLEALGMEKLAARIAKRLGEHKPAAPGKVVILFTVFGFQVYAPYKAEALEAWRKVGRWDPLTKRREVKPENKAALWALLKEFYTGYVLESPKGETVIGAARPAQPSTDTGRTSSAPPARQPRRDYAGGLEAALRRQFSAAVTDHKKTR